MENLLPYFERELSQLRRAGAEFAGRYPKPAGSLQMRGETRADPHVERLIQSCAFLIAQVPSTVSLPPDAGAVIHITVESTGVARSLALQGVTNIGALPLA